MNNCICDVDSYEVQYNCPMHGYNSICNEYEKEIDMLKTALEFYANSDNWKLNGPCDPNSSKFIGFQYANDILNKKS